MGLARLEGRIAIGRFVARFPDYRLSAPAVRSPPRPVSRTCRLAVPGRRLNHGLVYRTSPGELVVRPAK